MGYSGDLLPRRKRGSHRDLRLVEAQPLLFDDGGVGPDRNDADPRGDPSADLRADGGSISPCLQRRNRELYASS